MPARFTLFACLLASLCCAGQQQPPLTPAPSAAPGELAEEIAAILAEPAVARAHWGIAVSQVDGTPVYQLDEGKLFRPASTAKLFTTAAAMALLGPGFTQTTRLVGALDGDGVVTGDLVLQGDGDPSFGTDDLPYQPHAAAKAEPPDAPAALRDLVQLVDQLTARGVHEVRGGIVGDEMRFLHEPYPEGWSTEDLTWGYGAPISALSIADNQLELVITPGQTGHDGTAAPATAALHQFGTGFYRLSTALQTSAPPLPLEAGVNVDLPPGSRTLQISGVTQQGGAPIREHIAITAPAEFAATALGALLQERGIAVTGGAKAATFPVLSSGAYLPNLRRTDAPAARALAGQGIASSCGTPTPSGTVLAEHTSAPLAEDVVFTLKTSQNLHAEMMLHQLGRLYPCFRGSTLEGAQAVRAFLLQRAHLADGDFVFYDGSGLSTKDLVTPRAEVQLLLFARTQGWFPQWKAALPVGGVDGTLASRFPGPPLKGRVFAKTGTLGESRALAGYVQCASGQELVFSILSDNHEAGSSADRAAMDRIVEAIAALN